jgi:hypothetical protein
MRGHVRDEIHKRLFSYKTNNKAKTNNFVKCSVFSVECVCVCTVCLYLTCAHGARVLV